MKSLQKSKVCPSEQKDQMIYDGVNRAPQGMAKGQPTGNANVTSARMNEEDLKVKSVLSSLSPREMDVAARTAYAYQQDPRRSTQEMFASRIARRYLRAKQGKVDIATRRLKDTLEFREKIGVDGLRTAFDAGGSDSLSKPLLMQLRNKKLFVQGYDKEGRSTLIFIPRLVCGHHVEWTLKEAIYSVERAIACTKASDGTINAVVDFSGFSVLRHAPPLDVGRQFMTTLRNHYAGQIHRIYILNTPVAFSVFWNIFQPFLGSKTRGKIRFLSGKDRRKLEKYYDLDQVPSWMIPDGTKNKELDVQDYLYSTPFDRPFNE